MSDATRTVSGPARSGMTPLLMMLAGGVVLGALWPSTPSQPSNPGTEMAEESVGVAQRFAKGKGASGDAKGVAGFQANGTGGGRSIPSERLVPLFQRATKLKNETKQYAVTYQLASLMGVKELEAAMESALADVKKGDTVAVRALARRWAEIDPGGAALRALEMKNDAFAYPLVQSWKQMSPNGPYEWAKGLPASEQTAAFKMLLNQRALGAPEAEKVFGVAAAGLRSGSDDPAQKDIAVRSLRAVSAAAPDKAAQLATGLPDPALRTQELQAATAGWARKDEAGAAMWIKSSPSLNPKDREDLTKTLQMVAQQKKSKPVR